MLTNNSNPKGAKKLSRNELKSITGGTGAAVQNACGSSGCTYQEGGITKYGCPQYWTCLVYNCSNNEKRYSCRLQ
ncbi:bacteriocin-like protein [Pedobacter caeni]|uniref:Uncharacterized protein n=1 Tax=Pedobacter caeni TaxID=288992 RepID=A0A1M4ZSR4_9SPHI|nr:hypothetical protein [Pedobacter caeni]SHF21044.1 hypothetical protein SAMN04488522_102445 [Pedobacter caeni]